MTELLSQKVKRLTRALQRIADLPDPDKLTRPYKKSPKQIAILALKHRPRSPQGITGERQDG